MVKTDDDNFGAARDAEPPLDSVMLGLEEKRMGDVIDVRPDRLLREMREHGNMDKACQAAGMTIIELNALCRSNIKFDRAFVENHLEYLEEKVNSDTQKRIAGARAFAYKKLEERHPNG